MCLAEMRHEEADGVQQLYLNCRLLVGKPLLESHVPNAGCILYFHVKCFAVNYTCHDSIHFVEAEDSHEEQDDKA